MKNYEALAAADRDRRDAGTGQRAVDSRPSVSQQQRLAVGLTHGGAGDVPRRPRPRLHVLAAWLFDHRADLLAALVYGCLAFLSFSALSDYANAHRLFPLPYGGWTFAVAIDGAVLFAFIGFKRAPWLAGILLVSGAASTYTLQRWHAQGALHPLMVAGVVPGLMILVTFTWHRVRAAEARPTWPIDYPEPAPEPAPDPEPEPVPSSRPRPTQGEARRPGPVGRGRPSGNGALSKADMQALDRARKDPAVVERTVARRRLDRSAVAARPERWPLPSRNGNGP